MPGSLLRFLLFAAAAYGAIVAVATIFQRSLQYFPFGEPGTPAEAAVPDMREVFLSTADGLSLLSWYAPARNGRPTILYLHGNGFNLSARGPLVRPYLDAGYGMLLLSWRGYGGNPGKPTEAGLMEDGRAALAFLNEEGVPGEHLVLYGESLGSGIAVPLAVEMGVGAVVLEAPFTSAADVGRRYYWYLPVRWLMWDRYDSASRIAGINAPLLVAHGTSDRIVPVEMGKRLFALAVEPKELVLVEGATHDGLAAKASAEILDFLSRHFPDRVRLD